eukprot:TRINITY_DN111857_c0_g1_i1.p1 TRINITY_DN111857_c0_g1~~TRINITY_DN111857_c0_g1_i1.p1  ORF type:complete len:613 (-),score=159.91 TRINITY_DN111857_c0_g1_i1:41-1879(-)
MTSIHVEFEVLPPGHDGSRADPHEPSAGDVCHEISRQLQDPGSRLRRSEFGRYAERASLGIAGPGGEEFRDSLGPPLSGYEAPGRLSDGGLVDRISHLERELAHTAAGGGTHGSRGEAGEERHTPQQRHRLEQQDREIRELQESVRMYRAKAEQAEIKLKDKEQLLSHAKEMWMKENMRASKLSDSLTAAEDKLADQDRRLKEMGERLQRSEQEVRQLQHLVSGGLSNGHHDPAANGDSFGGKPAFGSTGAHGFGNGHDRRHGFDSSMMDDPALSDSSRRHHAGLAPLSSGHDLSTLGSSQSLGGAPETNADRFRRLCLVNDAVLFEDELLQIGVKAEYRGREAQVAVFFGNKGNAALQAFTVQYFVREDHAVRLSASPMSQQLDADTQVVQRVGVSLREPFAEPPWLRVQFLLPDASPRRIQTRFPVLVSKFMVGQDLAQAEFFRLWRQQDFMMSEATSVVNLAARLRGSSLVGVARGVVLGGSLRLHHGFDNNPDNLVLVGKLIEGLPGEAGGSLTGDRFDPREVAGAPAGAAGSPPLFGLIRIEIGTGRFAGKARIIVRAGSAADGLTLSQVGGQAAASCMARGLCDTLTVQLAESGAPSASDVDALAR